jgi:hypothetical protein
MSMTTFLAIKFPSIVNNNLYNLVNLIYFTHVISFLFLLNNNLAIY